MDKDEKNMTYVGRRAKSGRPPADAHSFVCGECGKKMWAHKDSLVQAMLATTRICDVCFIAEPTKYATPEQILDAETVMPGEQKTTTVREAFEKLTGKKPKDHTSHMVLSISIHAQSGEQIEEDLANRIIEEIHDGIESVYKPLKVEVKADVHCRHHCDDDCSRRSK